MLTRCILAERKKLRHSLILPACILIPIIPAIMGTFNYLQNLGNFKIRMVFSLDTAYFILCQFLFCTANRTLLLLLMASGTSKQ